MAENFGDKLRAWRKRKKLLQSQAAQVLGIPLDTYRAYEINRVSPHRTPSMQEIEQRMADAK